MNYASNRKLLIGVFAVLLVALLSLTMAYAALSTVLNISGNAEVVASNWDIHFDNATVVSGSSTTDVPVINSNKLSFSTTLNNPGDYYRFTVDVVNGGTIDAMIESFAKINDLTDEQKKFLKFDIMYTDGLSLSEKQLLSKNSSKNITVEVMFRKDISVDDLPTSAVNLDLSFSIVYYQADSSGTELTGGSFSSSALRVISGDLYTVGSEVCANDQCFYVISTDDDSVSLLAKYNLLVGNQYDSSTGTLTALTDPTGIQDSKALGCDGGINIVWYGGIAYSNSVYWSSLTTFPTYIYDENSILYEYVENYKAYLETYGVSINEARLIDFDELIELGCVQSTLDCSGAPSWLYQTTYWTGSAYNNKASVWFVNINGTFNGTSYKTAYGAGIRPVIEVPLSEF